MINHWSPKPGLKVQVLPPLPITLPGPTNSAYVIMGIGLMVLNKPYGFSNFTGVIKLVTWIRI